MEIFAEAKKYIKSNLVCMYPNKGDMVLVEFLVVSVVSCLLFYYYFFFYGFYSVMYVRYIYNYILTIVLKVLLCARQPLQFSVSILPYVYMYIIVRNECLSLLEALVWPPFYIC